MNRDQIIQKLTSRKFWICVAAFLGSLGTSWTGNATGNETLATVGAICATLSAAIYAASEAYVDGSRLKAQALEIEEKDESTRSKGTE